MTEEPLGTAELAELHSRLRSAPIPEPDEASWDEMVQRALARTGAQVTHGDLDAPDLLPRDWPGDADPVTEYGADDVGEVNRSGFDAEGATAFDSIHESSREYSSDGEHDSDLGDPDGGEHS